MARRFSAVAGRVAALSGGYVVFVLAVGVVLAWAVTGPLFGFSATWQLVINTGTTVVTFLMVFLIQNAQNRDALAVHLKLDELIRSIEPADNAVMRTEEAADDELAELKARYRALVGEQTDALAALGSGADRVDDCDTSAGRFCNRPVHRPS